MNVKQKQFSDRNVLVVLCLLLVLPCSSSYSERGEYKVQEKGNQLEVTSPWGKKTYTSATRLDVMKNYRIAIPIRDLMPVGAEESWDDWYDPDDWFDNEAAAKFDEAGAGTSTTTNNVTNAQGQPITINNILPPGVTPTPTPSPTPAEKKAEAEKEAEIDDTARLVVEANRFYNQGKYYEAQLYVEEVLRKKPKFVRAWIMKGSLLWVQGHKDLAQEAWQSVLAFDPENKQIKDLMMRYR